MTWTSVDMKSHKCFDATNKKVLGKFRDDC